MAKGKNNGNGKPRGKRRSKAESMTEAKANETEVRSGELGLAPVEISSSDFQFHMRAIKAATEKKDTANNLLRGCYKAANKVNKHLGAAIKEVISIERADDPAELKAELEVLGIALKEIGSPIQLTVHDVLSGDVNKAAYERGKNDGLNGRTCKSPFPDGSDLSEQYLTGWRNGTGSNLGLTEVETQAATAGSEGAPLPN